MGSSHAGGSDGSMGPNSSASSDHGKSMAASSPDKVLSHNTVIADKIKALTGKDATTACSGFKNLGQCVAAAHVANNLPGLSFDSLKSKMTGSSPESLGNAIQQLDPKANSKAEAKKAQKQADQDIQKASSSS